MFNGVIYFVGVYGTVYKDLLDETQGSQLGEETNLGLKN